ncbi:MAG: hypothetical protein P8Y99_17730 [Calditrichaceae bacterium]
MAEVKLPWILPPCPSVNDLVTNVSANNIQYLKYVIILVQAGYGAVCYCNSGKIIEHKLIRKYMVRKKQGKAQITYLHSKGKSRAGSRIRLAQTVKFFEEINEQVNAWIKNDELDRLLISCPPRLWGLLFQSKTKPQFSKKDPRILKIPMDIKIPNRDELNRVNKLAQKCIIEINGNLNLEWLKHITSNS